MGELITLVKKLLKEVLQFVQWAAASCALSESGGGGGATLRGTTRVICSDLPAERRTTASPGRMLLLALFCWMPKCQGADLKLCSMPCQLERALA
jgi:hypothetical protein